MSWILTKIETEQEMFTAAFKLPDFDNIKKVYTRFDESDECKSINYIAFHVSDVRAFDCVMDDVYPHDDDADANFFIFSELSEIEKNINHAGIEEMRVSWSDIVVCKDIVFDESRDAPRFSCWFQLGIKHSYEIYETQSFRDDEIFGEKG